ncbi:MAG: HAD family hydrolase [Clostridia bacterium]|nr:HAD family hydrolase [Clostridia bacterium]
MSIQAVLFDLDGTLLPMEQDAFVKAYFGLLARHLAPLGYQPEAVVSSIWAGTAAMVKNDGTKTNEEAFWQVFALQNGEKSLEHKAYLDEFYLEKFDGAQQACGYHPEAAKAVRAIREMGLRTILATNPIFPAAATRRRMAWAGLSSEDFELYTTYENSHSCKPNLSYYREILKTTGLSAEDCLMVGNDVGEDMVASELGMKVFLLTDCLINQKGIDISIYPNGSFAQLMEYVTALSEGCI